MSIVELFCYVDDFCNVFMGAWMRLLIAYGARQRHRQGRLSVSEIMTMLLLFQQSHYRDFKAFYLKEVCCQLHKQKVFLLLILLLLLFVILSE